MMTSQTSRLWTVLAVLLTGTGLAISQATPSTPPPNTSQDTPTMTLASGQDCYTQTNGLNCSFMRSHESEIATLMSLVLSKTDTVNSSDYKEIASVTAFTSDNVKVWNSLGAEVKGQLTQGGHSYIEFKWQAADSAVAGKYRCQVAGMDRFGHPVEKVQEMRINQQPENPLNLYNAIQEELNITRDELFDVNNELIMTKKDFNITKNELSDVNNELILTKKELNTTKNALFNVNNELAKTQSELNATKQQCQAPLTVPTTPPTVPTTPLRLPHGFIHATVYNNHRYLLSVDTPHNVTSHQAKCEQLGGYLVEVDTQDEWSHVVGFLRDLHLQDKWVYVGLTDEGHEGQWTYMTSQRPAQVLEWAVGQPNGGSRWNCAFLNTYDMKMYDYYCVSSGSELFLCEVAM